MAHPAPPPPYAPSRALVNRMSAVLMSSACQQIDFQIDGFHVDGSGFAAVALAFAGGAGMPLNTASNAVRVIAPRAAWPEPQRSDTGVNAFYNGGNNTFYIPTLEFGASSRADRRSIVHEATHCLVDITRARVRRLTNEAAAFIAGSLYGLLEDEPFAVVERVLIGHGHRFERGGVHDVAQSIARGLQVYPGAPVSQADAGRLYQAIQQHPTYANVRQNPDLMDRGDGVPF